MAAVFANHFASLPIAYGEFTTASASDTVVTGLGVLKAVFLTGAEAPDEENKFFWADIGDQAGTPAAGSFLLKSLKDTDADAAPTNATTFGIDVAWLAIGAA